MDQLCLAQVIAISLSFFWFSLFPPFSEKGWYSTHACLNSSQPHNHKHEHIYINTDISQYKALEETLQIQQRSNQATLADFLPYIQTVSHSVCLETAPCSIRRLTQPDILNDSKAQKVKERTTGCCNSHSQKDIRVVAFIQPGNCYVWIPQLSLPWKLTCKCAKVTSIVIKR